MSFCRPVTGRFPARSGDDSLWIRGHVLIGHQLPSSKTEKNLRRMRLRSVAHGATAIDPAFPGRAHLYPDHGQAASIFLDHQLGQMNYAKFGNADDGPKPSQLGVGASMLFQVQMAGG